MNSPRFDAHVDQAIASLRQRLLTDVAAVTANTRSKGGIRREWRQLVRRLAELRSATRPPVQTSAHDSRS